MDIIAINEAIQILNKLQMATASGSQYVWDILRHAETHLNKQVKEHFAE